MKLRHFTAACALQVLAATSSCAQVPQPPAPQPQPPAPAALFSDAERARIVAFWNAPGRYQIGPRDNALRDGAFAVRLSPQASIWFRAYNEALKPGKLPPNLTVAPTNERTARWEFWVVAKLAHDRWAAQQATERANASARTAVSTAPAVVEPPLPGVTPPDLLAAVENPPPFAVVTAPLKHTITFADGQSLSYHDHLAISSPRYAYYRFDEGVSSEGLALRSWPERELTDFFARSGLSRFESNVMRAVSRLEGGFDSVNTYDTGFVSVGFIQFASLAEGAGSLGPVLRGQKATRREDFERDFRQFGLDVDADSTLVAVDPATGAELRGPEANRAIIADKRLIAVFQHAGRTSAAFRTAQITEAKRRFYPADNEFTVNLNGQIMRGRVRDIVRSEAGMATLLDRSVNLGNIRLLGDEVARLMRERGLNRLDQVAAFERELIRRLKWRVDFLSDASLSQPRG